MAFRQLTGALDSEDTRVMIDGLGRLGIEVESHDAGTTLVVHGAGGEIPALEADFFCANSGTTIRFLTALATLGHGSFRLDGVERMRERPIGDLLDALNQLGTHAASENGDNCPPVVVHANGLPGGTAKIRGDISSQYLSGVLMAAPARAIAGRAGHRWAAGLAAIRADDARCDEVIWRRRGNG